ncbi:MAG: YicC/YloC family endoribonuclease [Myxococcota bacterium]
MQSMTGYGSGRATLGGGHVLIDLRAVNHRYLDARVRLPARIQSATPVVERVIRERLERGRVDATARFEGQTLPPPALDIDRARDAFEQLRSLRDALSPSDPLPLGLLANVPDLFTATRRLDEDELQHALTTATETACEAVQAMRQREGDALREELGQLVDAFERGAEEVERQVPALIEGRQDRLRDRVNALLADVDTELEPGRLEQEIAIVADRTDISEELARLRSHGTQMRELLGNSDSPVGKRMDFLLQEIGREVNTIGSKIQDGAITTQVIALKAGVEQMREQAQNVL